LKKGDQVKLTYEGHTVHGTLVLASPNSLSLFVSFEAILGGHVGGMALFKESDGEPYRSLHSGLVASVELL
jgi:hypothetical protein